MDSKTIISFFIAPAIMIILALLSFKIMDRKTFKSYLGSYFLGILAVIPMILALVVANHFGMVHDRSIRRILFFSFFLVGFFAEFSKYLLLRFYFLPKDLISKPVDGILYSVNIALGFATVANIYFSLQWSGLLSIHIVNFSLPFANLLFGVIMGFFLGMAKFRTNYIDSLTGLGTAIFFQGFYNFCLISHDYLLLGLVSLGTLIIAIMLVVKSISTDTENIV
jgi:RsiW-degrading membrane proteinase PrsW (M82 family)